MGDDTELDETSRELLEAWTVPEMPGDLEARVMTKVAEQWAMPMVPPPETWGTRTSWRTHTATTAAVFALGAAAAAALVLAITGRPPAPAQPAVVAAPAIEVAAPGHLTLTVVPTDAAVEIDGVAVAGPSPFVATNLVPGKHVLRIHRAGHMPWSRELDVPSGQLHVPIVLAPLHSPLAENGLSGMALAALTAMFETDPKSAGRLDKDAIRKVVADNIDEIRHCYNEGLVRDPQLAGRVVVTFVIGTSGAVSSSQVAESTVRDVQVGNCIATTVGSWTFPAPEGGSVTVTYPFVLEPE